MFRKILGGGVILLGALNISSALAQDWSANLGFNSEYIYRGIPQKSSSALNATADVCQRCRKYQIIILNA